MRKVTLLLLSVILLLLTSCATKKPFVQQKVLEKSALLYIYVPNQISLESEPDRDIDYKIKIGNELIDGYIRDGEYMVFNIKPSIAVVTVIKNAILKHTVTLELQAQKNYYIKILKNEDDEFQVLNIQEKEAFNEISKTGLSNSVLISDDEINKNIIKEDDKNSSKLQKIERAIKLKKEGIITVEEFNVLKKEILISN